MESRLIRMLKGFCYAADILNEWAGKIFSWLVIPLTILVSIEVILRYVFDRPTIWIWDINIQILGALIVFSGGYTLLRGAHIGIDVLIENWSPRKKVIIDIVTYPFFLFSMGILFWKAVSEAWVSVQVGEMYNSFFRPPIYPLKVAISVGVLLFFVQGTAKFLRDVLAVASSMKEVDRD